MPMLTFHDMFVDDFMADTLKIMCCFSLSMLLVLSREYLLARGLFSGEFFVLILFALLGMMVMISAHHFLTLYLGLELLTLSSYALVALQRDSARSTEAAMKYFVLGALASGLLLYGMSMLYGATGTLDIAQIAQALRPGIAGDKTVLVFGLVFIVAGLAFKLGAVPFHMWIPDVYHGAPTAVTLVHRLGTEDRRVCICYAPVGFRARTVGRRLARHADYSCSAVDGRRQHRRHRAKQLEAHVGLLDHFAHGIFVARDSWPAAKTATAHRCSTSLPMRSPTSAHSA